MHTLSKLAADYVADRDVCPIYAARLCKRATAFEQHAGETALDRLLAEPTLSAFLKSLSGSPYTVRSYRGDLLTLWNDATERDLAPAPRIRRIYKPGKPDLIIDCYMRDEALALLAEAAKLKGRYANGISRCDYWDAAIRKAWDTGLRRGDVWKVRRDWIRPDCTMRVVQSKTGKAVTVRLRESTVAALDRIGRPQPCEWVLDPAYFGRHFKRLVRRSGVNRGTFKWLRRASGSYVELAQSGAGHKHLGHDDPTTFDKHYDAKLGGHTLPMPPEL
jgi:integrase